MGINHSVDRAHSALRAFNRAAGRIELFLAAFFLALLVLANTVAVGGRVLFAIYPSWIIEVSVTLVIWTVFVGAAYLYKQRGHVAVTLVYDQLKPGGAARRAMDIVSEVLVLVFVLVALWQAAIYQPILALRVTTALQLPQNLVSIFIPIAFVSMFLSGLEFLLTQLRRNQ